MDVFERIPLNERIEFKHVDEAGRQRRAMLSVINWAVECIGLKDHRAQVYESHVLHGFDSGLTVDRLIAEIGTDLERAGKPSAAGLAGVIFALALQDLVSTTPGDPAASANPATAAG